MAPSHKTMGQVIIKIQQHIGEPHMNQLKPSFQNPCPLPLGIGLFILRDLILHGNVTPCVSQWPCVSRGVCVSTRVCVCMVNDLCSVNLCYT